MHLRSRVHRPAPPSPFQPSPTRQQLNSSALRGISLFQSRGRQPAPSSLFHALPLSFRLSLDPRRLNSDTARGNTRFFLRGHRPAPQLQLHAPPPRLHAPPSPSPLSPAPRQLNAGPVRENTRPRSRAQQPETPSPIPFSLAPGRLNSKPTRGNPHFRSCERSKALYLFRGRIRGRRTSFCVCHHTNKVRGWGLRTRCARSESRDDHPR